MFKSLSLAATVAIGALLPAIAFAEDINVKLWTLADKNAPARVTNIEAAAGIMNAQFKGRRRRQAHRRRHEQ
ncbi:Uncharacterised protein [Agrobacterium tumefaciens]|nr:Uncharacterised protein [Agrobacterium tumefaciens]